MSPRQGKNRRRAGRGERARAGARAGVRLRRRHRYRRPAAKAPPAQAVSLIDVTAALARFPAALSATSTTSTTSCPTTISAARRPSRSRPRSTLQELEGHALGRLHGELRIRGRTRHDVQGAHRRPRRYERARRRSRYALGVRGNYAFGSTLGNIVSAGAEFGGQSFIVDHPPPVRGNANIPNVEYKFIRPNLHGALPRHRSGSPCIGSAGYLMVSSAGEIVSAGLLPRSHLERQRARPRHRSSPTRSR